MIETDIIAYIQIIKGKINADMDKLSKLLWEIIIIDYLIMYHP